MRREITTTPYQPHRWVDELPDTAWANFGVWRDQAFRCEGNGQRLAYRLDAHVFDCDNRGARIAQLRPADRMFEDLAAGIYRLATEDCGARMEAIVEIFGSEAKWDVWEIIVAYMEEPEMPEHFRNLQGRIIDRIESGRWNDADLAWVQRRAAEQVTDEDLLSLSPFDGGKEGDVRELARKVVRGRRDHRCHGTGLVIPAGEPHLFLRELIDGEFYATRHGRVAAWFSAHADAPDLAEMLKRDEAPLATAA
ncbi:hypothetical protein ABZT49_06115 [Methylobacterium sp. EM32]|uniref:hypothetical protein n=1 Tax=Methylobacterium sp. EM32 TaxID=3163481 RepID=UPI0033A51382